MIYEFVQSLNRSDPNDWNKYLFSDRGFDFTTKESIEKFLGIEISKYRDIITLR